MPLPRDPRPHLLLPESVTSTSPYRAVTGSSRGVDIPEQPRHAHAHRLRTGLQSVATDFSAIKTRQEAAGWTDGFGITVRFSSFPDVHLAIESLEQRQHGIELLNVRVEGQETIACVWIPEGRLDVFERKITDYLAEKKDSKNRPRDNRRLIDAIREIRTEVLEGLWTDAGPLPAGDAETRFEVWVSTPRARTKSGADVETLTLEDTNARIERFRTAAAAAGLHVSERVLHFPERAVVQVRGTVAMLRSSAHVLGQVGELRRAPETPAFFMGLAPPEQQELAEGLLGRTTFSGPDASAPHVCILDTGCTHAHPLLASAIGGEDTHTVEPAWGTADVHGHGTEQAGLALWGDLTDPLNEAGPIVIQHRLESVKVIPRDNANLDEHFGPLTAQAVSLPEVAAPDRKRLYSMALTSTVTTMHGRPTAWSAEVDALTSDWAGDGESPRLMLVSAGNVFVSNPAQYTALNDGTSVEDPAQAWNALTIGAITHKVQITEADGANYQPLASAGGLGPNSSTSVSWRHDAPLKPEVVFEGGNLAHDAGFVSNLDSLSLLTTSHRPMERLLSTSMATSAATALASRFSARVMARYPDFWPETIRALVVHSARWTPELLRQFPGTTKAATEERLRRCGWGEPDLDTALHSGADALTLLVQGRLHPFARSSGGGITAREMHLHRLPWPINALQELFAQNVELRVTLSYFVEPNPGERGRSNRFAYASHGLRFAVQKPAETIDAFRRRINRLARDSEEGMEPAYGGDTDWILGYRKRFRGSLHHDRLTNRAADLAGREHIAVFPTSGWWKTRDAQDRFDREARYALVVSIHAPDVPSNIDLYNSVEQALQSIVATPVTRES
jgi:hypothetical protein